MYFPLSTGLGDLGSSGLHIVKVNADVDQGNWGVYTHAPLPVMKQGWELQSQRFIAPNRNLPTTQISSRDQGFHANEADSFLLEFQAYLPLVRV